MANRFDVVRFVTHVEGNRAPEGMGKALVLGQHVDRLVADLAALEPEPVVAIGDSLDDAEAAAAVGVGAVLYDGGSHHR